ncbi:MAG: DNA polymerase III subunit beta [Candidatus Scalindua rubra]|uniref:Beta sliding clamp n=1 Tax=Candidatus Scalindua brodae TaxID=237368 RepID=A0A0B0ES98_9BACT|nr:MAG: DNA polymerase III beta subunit [Candidatus Scalindua brodae]MBZ0107779.1 DNA polymerase III subunit beta [Candidatus Scalindua rubra]
MKIKCNKEIIRKGFHVVENVISGSNVNPMLQNVRIVAKDNTLELSTTDMEVSVSYLIDSVEVITPGKMVGPETQISSIVKEWTEDSIEITEENNKCIIKGKDNFFKILCTDSDGFPTIPQFVDDEYIEIDKDVLLDMIKKTAFIILGDKTKHGTSGVFLEISDNHIKMVANDGRRLSEVKKKVENSHGISKSCIIPIKGMLQMQRIAGEQTDLIKIRIEEKRIFVKTKNSTLCSQLLEGQYPKYEEVIPTNLDKKINMDRNAFTSAIRRVSIMTTDEYKLLRFKFSDETLEIKCSSPDVGESKTVIPVEYFGEEIEIGLNPEFLLDFLKNVDSEEVLLELKDHGTAGVFRVGTGCTYVVMPMNLGDKKQV